MLERWWIWIVIGATAVLALVGAFVGGRVTAGDSPTETTVAALEEPVPTYGDQDSRSAYVAAVRSALFPELPATDAELLAAGDSTCADLEGFTRHGRDAHDAIRILWTDRLRYLESDEAAVAGVILAAAPEYLCLQFKELAADIAYWLGI